MKIVLMHQTVTNHDAIGNDIEIMYGILKERYECFVYAQNCFNSHVEYIADEKLEEILQDENNIVLYHHSVFWEMGETFLRAAQAKIVFRYHNITPEGFFEGYNEHHYSQCKLGRLQTVRLAKDFKKALWLCDSWYNAEDVEEYVEKERIAICPPFNKIEEWGSKVPDEQILRELLHSQTINLLFVGRVAPNKGHLQLLDVLYSFCRNYEERIKLRIVGKFDEGLPLYNDLIKNRMIEYGLEECVEFIGEINDATLMSYYLGSDVFLCLSEHEGFCVPLIEANYFEIPVIAKDTSAICETLGKKQLILADDMKAYAAGIHVIMNQKAARDMLIEAGRNNYASRFTCTEIKKIFCGILNEKYNMGL
ncbi:MAG: glycosyltransferase family 4 protein [Lachnospiraceae bacterium]|nr:glycosyltransferase family 4 protein [Lachnospiraceae bacterium]MBO5176763.1 glycosyltransferase family 4 protein [Lachnospiraceae bacterium]